MIDFAKITDRFLSDMEKNTDRVMAYGKDAWDVMFDSLNDRIAETPYDVIWECDRVRLKHYRSTAAGKAERKTPLLVVYALINRETMLDLQPERSVVQKFLADGMDLYMIDWGYPTQKDKFLTIDDHVNGYMDDVVDFIRNREGVEKINLMGICMGGTFSTIYATFHPEKVRNLVLTVTPTSFDHNQGLLHVWMQNTNVDKLLEAYGNMPGDLMNFGFLLLNPARLIIDKYKSFLSKLDDKPFVENFVRMEKWIFDSPDVPGETFRQFINDLYKKNLLVKNQLMVGGRRVDLTRVTMPVLNIYARFDHLVPPAACDQITGCLASTDKKDVCLDTGHIGIYVSSKYQNEFVPMISNWLLDRDRETEAATSARSEEKAKARRAPRKKASAPRPAMTATATRKKNLST